MTALNCFHCKKAVEPSTSPSGVRVGFRDTCPACHSDLHVCRNCSFYDEGSYHECRESSAEWVKNKERANICEYFKPAGDRATAGGDQKAKSLAALDDLFKK
jgi:hypothetical protein